ncbi:SufE family protein [Alphaproteobacteria bacterium]|jgi:cysteine desulfuration protein SufE|nr:SufE family protein [Alphaproteobacteria bacterium]MBT5798873.1 SufE family protein [Alphaproteobacteria bacterium]MDA9189992.1 SufE family protein [Alphaproteobacteria bacterium]
MNKNITTEIEEIIDEFSFFDDWADRYQHLIDLGRKLPNLPEKYQNDSYKLSGCQSTVWFVADKTEDNLIQFKAQSDAAIVQGLVALMLRVYSGRTAAEILSTNPDFLTEIGLDKHLSPSRKNGLSAMITKIRTSASQLVK